MSWLTTGILDSFGASEVWLEMIEIVTRESRVTHAKTELGQEFSRGTKD